MGLFNVNASLYADLNLVFQISILILLFVGILIARRKRKFKRHGALMGIALTLNTISIVIVMLPSFLSFSGLFADLSTPAAIVITHAVLGVLVEVLGVWLVANWLVRSDNIKGCVGKRNLMRATLLLWSIELFVGIYVYIMLYVPI
ncbi:MAG: DUF420 domain-containing protein [Candidatus Bathyarchaeota archaeon]|nr:MAG: DUF420 domain-containing protein [Candidatus Bathyarchaeota archaeon]